ncbi:MAG: DNA-protecting protein DprA [Actinomycetota bacterium]|nr:DNA-protecting protein DprA [Actinomycetota bacterium]
MSDARLHDAVRGDDHELAHLLALSGLTGLGPSRLRALVAAERPSGAWSRVRSGDLPDALARAVSDQVAARWRRAAARVDPPAVLARHRGLGIRVVLEGDAAWPARLRDDPEPPALLLAAGELEALARPTVAVIGTRRATPYGLDVATELGEALTGAGVGVVSGLARGIDAAAHRGALGTAGAPPVGVVATGLDVVYPRSSADVWDGVAARGVLVSEAALGTDAERWRFPARNRIIAALADAVVVVESHERGGSMHTVAEAVRRDRPVLAVPGPIRSPSSRGTNRLVFDGASPLCDVADVLELLEIVTPDGAIATDDLPAGLEPLERAVLDRLGWEPRSQDEIVAALGVSLTEVARAVERLRRLHLVERQGAWICRRSRIDGRPAGRTSVQP